VSRALVQQAAECQSQGNKKARALIGDCKSARARKSQNHGVDRLFQRTLPSINSNNCDIFLDIKKKFANKSIMLVFTSVSLQAVLSTKISVCARTSLGRAAGPTLYGHSIFAIGVRFS
jgi:hypothetical protein